MILLRSFRLDDGKDVVSVWHDSERGKVKAGLASRMVHLRQQPRDSWIRPYYDTLRGGVGAVRWKVERIQHRAIGYFGPSRNEFTFLVLTTKTTYNESEIDAAIAMRARVERDPSMSLVIKGRWGQ